jgi:hypothetical protein
MELDLILILVIIGVLGVLYLKNGGALGSLLPKIGTIPLGGACNNSLNCEGHDVGVGPGNTCDLGVCVPKKQDWAKAWYAPSECVDRPGGAHGSCSSGFSWPRKIDQPCNIHEDCENYGYGKTGCDRGTCKQQKQDWAKVWYLPSECVGTVGGQPGTC